MSHIGKLSRGLKWWKNNRNLDGNLLPIVSEDSSKMEDVNYYLEYTKGKDMLMVDTALHQIFQLTHAAGGITSRLYKEIKAKLDGGDAKDFTPKEETKSKGKK